MMLDWSPQYGVRVGKSTPVLVSGRVKVKTSCFVERAGETGASGGNLTRLSSTSAHVGVKSSTVEVIRHGNY